MGSAHNIVYCVVLSTDLAVLHVLIYLDPSDAHGALALPVLTFSLSRFLSFPLYSRFQSL